MVSAFVPSIISLCELLDEFAQKQNDSKLNKLQSVCNELSLRIRINLEATVPHLKKYDKGFINESLPISLIMRSVVSDIITFCYLCTFYNTESDSFDQPSLENELNLQDKDVIKSFEQVMDLEKEMADIIPGMSTGLTDDQISAVKQKLRLRFKTLFKETGQFKSTEEIRLTSLEKYFPGSQRNIPLTEKSKADKIRKAPIVDKFSPAYNMFKYYSQFQQQGFLSKLKKQRSRFEDLIREAGN